MTNHATLLKMIEEVDPSDTDALDEIDARVWCFIENIEYKNHELREGDMAYRTRDAILINKVPYPYGDDFDCEICEYFYTRSLDAQESLIPDNWIFTNMWYGLDDHSEMQYEMRRAPYTNNDPALSSEYLPTERLARLYTIIQAIAYERENND